MTAPAPSRWKRRCRRCIRVFTSLLLLLALFVAAVVAYLDRVGLPDFIKRPLLDKLRTQGINLSFSRMRWNFERGVVAENVSFGRADAPPDSPHFAAHEVELQLDHAALRHLAISVDGLFLRGGEAAWPVGETNGPPRLLAISDIQAQLRFPGADLWELDNFSATFAGARLKVSGSVTNASAIRDWPVFHAPPGERPGQLEPSFRDFAKTLDRIKFTTAPELDLFLRGDGLDLQSFRVMLTVRARDADTPWGKLVNGSLTARVIPPGTTNAQRHAAFSLRADGARTPWGELKNLRLEAQAANDPADTNLVHCQLESRAEAIRTPWAGATRAVATATWSHSFTNAIPISGVGEVRLANGRSRWATVQDVWLTARMTTPVRTNPLRADETWGWWAKLEPFALDWDCRLTNLGVEDTRVQAVALGGWWRAPQLTITNLTSHVFDGELNLDGGLNVATRAVRFHGSTDFDAHKAAALLPQDARATLADITWEKPPLLIAEGNVVLPAWTNPSTNWPAEMRSSLQMGAELALGPTAYRTVALLSAHTHINVSNLVWSIPDLIVNRPEGALLLAATADQRTEEFSLRVHSAISHQAVRPLLGTDAQVVLDSIVLPQPPVIDAEIHGRGSAATALNLSGSIATTNILIRGESADSIRANFRYANQLLEVTNPRVERQGRQATATLVLIDFPAHRLYLTNAISNLDPVPLLHIIGPQVTATMAPYQFLTPPAIRVSGIVPLGDNVPADLVFHVAGGPFHWNRFNVAQVDTGVHWVADHLYLTDLKTEFYGGQMTGGTTFDFSPKVGNLFTLICNLTNVDLHPFIADAFLAPTNHLEGRLNGQVTITEANTDDWKSWFGHGELELRDGLIWEVPIFGVFSKVLDTFSPTLKLGESRATAATAAFIITNSVVRSENVQIAARGVRMKYRGTVDFDGRTDAIVEASILKGTPVIGPLVSLVLTPLTKVFEYKVRGTLSDPKAEPLYVPKLLMNFLHPFGTLKRLFPTETGGTTNAPAGPKGP